MSDDPIIRIDEQGVMIKLSGDKEVARRQWEKARKLINMHLEIDVDVDEEPESQPKTESKSKSKKPWSDEEERIIADNLDQKPMQLKELLKEAGYERTYGSADQKKREILGQQEEREQQQQQQNQENQGNWTDEGGLIKRSWSNEEEQHIINEYHNKKLAEIAQDLNRSYSSTYQKKDKLVSEGRLTPKEKQKRPDDRIDEIRREAEPENESGDSYPDTLIQYLWNHTDWKHYKNRDDRIRAIQKILRDRYGMAVSEERIVEIVGLDHEDR